MAAALVSRSEADRERDREREKDETERGNDKTEHARKSALEIIDLVGSLPAASMRRNCRRLNGTGDCQIGPAQKCAADVIRADARNGLNPLKIAAERKDSILYVLRVGSVLGGKWLISPLDGNQGDIGTPEEELFLCTDMWRVLNRDGQEMITLDGAVAVVVDEVFVYRTESNKVMATSNAPLANMAVVLLDQAATQTQLDFILHDVQCGMPVKCVILDFRS